MSFIADKRKVIPNLTAKYANHIICTLPCWYERTLFQKNDSDVAHHNFNAHQPTLVIIYRHIDERVCYQMMIYPTSPN